MIAFDLLSFAGKIIFDNGQKMFISAFAGW